MEIEGKQSVCGGIAERIKRDIALGIITDGEKLPSCRELAMQLGVNPNTVQRAYSQLEAEGYIDSIPKKGAYARRAPMRENLTEQAEKQLTALKNAGMSKQTLTEILEKIFKEI